MSPVEAPSLSQEQFEELYALIQDADSVELKLTVPEADQRGTARALGLDPLAAQIRQVFFFDTPELKLNDAGVVVRARRVQKKGEDSVVKLRPVVPTELDTSFVGSPAFGIEVDAMPGGFICSGSMKGTLGATDVQEVSTGNRRVGKLFSKEQKAFY